MKSNSKKIKVLFFANLPTDDVRSIGGAATLSRRILDFVRNDERFEIEQVQIRTFWKSKFQLIDYFFWFFKFPFLIRRFDIVSFHVTRDFNVSIAPFLLMWTKILNKKTLYHMFGGGFHSVYDKTPGFLKWFLSKSILKVDALVLETKQLISYFESLGLKNLIWLPNSRQPIENFTKNRQYQKKFVMISRLMPDKGIPEIIEAAEILPKDYQVDVYGPFDPKYYKKNPFEGTKVNYKGILHHDEVIPTLDKYNILLMPTYISREGYPGIIIEALSIGIPVITTDCCVMDEMITHNENGLLIEKQSGKALADAMQSFSDANYKTFQEKALDSFYKNFNSNKVFKKITEAYLSMYETK